MSELCYCGKPLHYNSPHVKTYIEKLINDLGSHVNISIYDDNYKVRTFSVPRHYIALHGVSGKNLEHLGFEEVTNK